MDPTVAPFLGRNVSTFSVWKWPPLKLFLFLSLPTHTWAELGARVRQGAGGDRALLLLTGDLASLGGMLGERSSRDEADLGCDRA